MKELPLTPRGTRIQNGKPYRVFLDEASVILEKAGFTELLLPSIDFTERYRNKMGKDIDDEMYTFTDKGGRDLCLRPEVTATVQAMFNEREIDQKVWYFEKCFRYERPQKGRYREFYQLGVEILNPSQNYTQELIDLATELVSIVTNKFVIDVSAKRGLTYYTSEGFEFICPELGAQKQVVGGGPYKEGIGFAIGVDRLLLTK